MPSSFSQEHAYDKTERGGFLIHAFERKGISSYNREVDEQDCLEDHVNARSLSLDHVIRARHVVT